MAAAVGHATPNPIPTFAEQGYQLLINDQLVADPATVTLSVGSTYEVAIRASATPFRGALIRVDGQGILEAGQNAALATVCTTVPGVGHTENSEKIFLSGIYEVTGGTSVTLDITVVETNSDESIYSYQQFQLAVDEAVATTNAPVPSPTPPPTELSERSQTFWEAVVAFFGALREILGSIGM